MFNSAIQTLSEMAIADKGTKVPQTTTIGVVEEVKATLDELNTIPVSECKFLAEMVPVRESKRFDKYLIEMEDLSRYMVSNGVSSVTEAINDILTINGLQGQYHNTALIIDEASILEEVNTLGIGTDDKMNDWAEGGLGKGFYGDQTNVMTYRKFANTKQMLDTFLNKYGIQLIKKNYTVGIGTMNESTEDVQLKVEPKDQVIHEKDKKEDLTYDKYVDGNDDELDDELDDMLGLGDVESEDDDKDLSPEDETDAIQESAHEEHLQYLRDIAAGKFDKELL